MSASVSPLQQIIETARRFIKLPTVDTDSKRVIGELLAALAAPVVPHSMALSLHRCTVCGTRWLLWPDAVHGGGWNLLDKYSQPGQCCNNVAMGEQIEHLRDFDLSQLAAPVVPQQSDRLKCIEATVCHLRRFGHRCERPAANRTYVLLDEVLLVIRDPTSFGQLAASRPRAVEPTKEQS